MDGRYVASSVTVLLGAPTPPVAFCMMLNTVSGFITTFLLKTFLLAMATLIADTFWGVLGLDPVVIKTVAVVTHVYTSVCCVNLLCDNGG
jgi:hypothetical protein